MSQQQEQVRQREQYEERQRASNAATEQASAMARQQMEETLRNPQFAETIRDPDLEDKYERDVGPDVSKAHAVANLDDADKERNYWLTKNRTERRITESRAGMLLKENPGLLAVAQQARKPSGIEAADSKPMTTKERRKMRGSYEVSHSIKSLGVDAKGLESLTTATAEHRTVTNEQEQSEGVKNRVRAFFD